MVKGLSCCKHCADADTVTRYDENYTQRKHSHIHNQRFFAEENKKFCPGKNRSDHICLALVNKETIPLELTRVETKHEHVLTHMRYSHRCQINL